MPTPQKNHDLRLPDWGPYTKRYTGISHIPDVKKGLRFDIAIIPGHYRRQVLIPNAKWESGHHPWEAAPDLSFYSYRYELEWKDQVFCDVSFSALADGARLIRCQFVNNTATTQNTALHLMAYMNFPPVRPYSDEPVRPAVVELPHGATWYEALDYDDLRFATPRPTDSLVYDAMLRGEIRQHGFVNGSGVGMGFGQEAGDTIIYRLHLSQPLENGALVVRYRSNGLGATRFALEGISSQQVELPGGKGFQLASIAIGSLPAGEAYLRLTSQGGPGIDLDGFAMLPEHLQDKVSFSQHEWNPVPEILPGPTPNSIILKYADAEQTYGLAWNYPDFWVREVFNDELDRFFRHMVHEHVQRVLRGPGDGHFTDVFLRPITIPPHSDQTIYSMACSGSRAEVEQRLAAFETDPNRLEAAYTNARARAARMTGGDSARPYSFSQERMAATTLMNVVYPVYTRRTFIRHNTPGKWWDCLYTWDSGFIGLGLLEIDIERAIDNLNAYVTDPGDDQAAFVHHGSFVPVQMYLFHELWNRTQSRELLEYFYPRLRQYYLFMAGWLGSSTTRVLKSNLLKTWDYFYNSGGWDDYPPQVHVRQNGLEQWVTPVVNTAHAIRSAKILRAAAEALGETTDIAIFDQDIESFTQALQTHSWDEESGYFSYVVHDDEGCPREILRHESGANFDMGMDGASPLYAGACTAAQEDRLFQHLFSPNQMWTRIGLSTVDQSAPYYRKEGYWNGAVWMPHQWFFWKAMLDLGRGELAHQVAQTALNVWKDEVENTYNCCEHFIVQSGRGAGWHQFSGLSTPVLAWFGAYHRLGRLTTGLDAWVERQAFSGHNRSFEADLKLSCTEGKAPTILVNMQPGLEYSARWNNQDVACKEVTPGSLQITLPPGQKAGRVVVATP